MAKNELTDYSTTASNNTDIGGVGITDADSADKIRDAEQQLAAAIARYLAGTAPISDTAKVRNVTDTTKTYDISAANIPTGTNRSLDAEALFRNGAWLETVYTASGTHTFQAKSRYFQLWAVGGGGGGGGVDGQGAGTKAAASGGGSGFYGNTSVLAVGSIIPDGDGDYIGTIVIGTAGSGGAGSGGSSGSNGGNTTWNDGTNSFTWGGGKGGLGAIADTGTSALAGPPNRATASAALLGTSSRSTVGSLTTAPSASPDFVPVANGGLGGDSQWGQGGAGGQGAGSGGGSAGSDAFGYGVGGGGAAVTEVNTNYPGGAGTPGILIVREW
jgi:hypothetical protein